MATTRCATRGVGRPQQQEIDMNTRSGGIGIVGVIIIVVVILFLVGAI